MVAVVAFVASRKASFPNVVRKTVAPLFMALGLGGSVLVFTPSAIFPPKEELETRRGVLNDLAEPLNQMRFLTTLREHITVTNEDIFFLKVDDIDLVWNIITETLEFPPS